MKKLIISSLFVLLALIGAPSALAQSQVPSGGTGLKYINAGNILFGNGVNAISTSSMLTVSTSTNSFVIGNGVASFYTNMGCNQGTACLQITQNNSSGIGLEINANSNNATAKALRIYNSGLQDIFDIFSNGNTYSTGVLTLIGGAGIAGNVGISGILTATTSTITGPCAVICLTVKNTDPDGGAAALKSDATPSAQHTFTIGYNLLKSGIVNTWFDNNGSASLSGSGTGSTTIGTATGLGKSKLQVNGNLTIGDSTYLNTNIGDDNGLVVKGGACFACNIISDNIDKFTVNETAGFASSVAFYSTLTASGNAGTNGQLLQTTGTGIQWVSTSTIVSPTINYAQGSRFAGQRFDFWKYPQQITSSASLSTAFVASTTYAWPWTQLKNETYTGVLVRVITNVAGSSVSCGFYATTGAGGNLYATNVIAGPWIFESSTTGLKFASTTPFTLTQGVTYATGCYSSSTPTISTPNNTATQSIMGTDGVNMQVAFSSTTSTSNVTQFQNLPDPFPTNAIMRSTVVPTFQVQ